MPTDNQDIRGTSLFLLEAVEWVQSQEAIQDSCDCNRKPMSSFRTDTLPAPTAL